MAGARELQVFPGGGAGAPPGALAGTAGATPGELPAGNLTDLLVTAGGGHTCALLPGGTVSCWGLNREGQLGDGTLTDRSSPAAVPGLSGVTAVAAGDQHTCALLPGGTVSCWGRNINGELGDGTTTILRSSPTAVPGLSGVPQSRQDTSTPAPCSRAGPSPVGDTMAGGSSATEPPPTAPRPPPSAASPALPRSRQAKDTPAPFSRAAPSPVGDTIALDSSATELPPTAPRPRPSPASPA